MTLDEVLASEQAHQCKAVALFRRGKGAPFVASH